MTSKKTAKRRSRKSGPDQEAVDQVVTERAQQAQALRKRPEGSQPEQKQPNALVAPAQQGSEVLEQLIQWALRGGDDRSGALKAVDLARQVFRAIHIPQKQGAA